MKQTRKEIEEKVLAAVQDAYCMSSKDDTLVLESKFTDLGFDSLDIAELVMEIEDEFDIDVTDEDARKWAESSIKGLVDYVDGKLNS